MSDFENVTQAEMLADEKRLGNFEIALAHIDVKIRVTERDLAVGNPVPGGAEALRQLETQRDDLLYALQTGETRQETAARIQREEEERRMNERVSRHTEKVYQKYYGKEGGE